MTGGASAVLDRDHLRATIRAAFGIGSPVAKRRLGFEVEAIPIVLATGRPAPLDLSWHALSRLGWEAYQSPKSSARELRRPDGARLTFEPGGQIEYSSAPHPTGSTLLADVEGAIAAIRDALGAAGCMLLFRGLDPNTSIEDVPLQLEAPRYRRMDAYFASIGPSGRRMMRQTASIQLCVDAGPEPIDRWRLLSRLAPVAAAAFANSSVDAGVLAGEVSRRRRIWAELDPARTGLPALGTDPVEEYLDFALHAPAFLLGDDPARAKPFAHWLARGASLEQWSEHLSTLFPDVRPRGYFEFRVADAIEGDALPALIALIAGPAWHAESGTRLSRELPPLLWSTPKDLMARAGTRGLADDELRAAARCCTSTAIDACDALGDALLTPADRLRARRYFDSHTFAGRAPADDATAALELIHS